MTWGKTAVFIACVCGTICFVGILGFHSLQTQLHQLIASNSVALPKPVQVATASNSANAVAIANGLFIKAMSQGGDRVNQIYYQTVMNELLAMVASTPGARAN